MTQRSEAALKAFFETGDKPTESQFADFIESYLNTIDKGPAVTRNFGEFANDATAGMGIETLGSTFVLPANSLNVNGAVLKIIAFGSDTSNTNSKSIGFRFGATSKLIALSSSQEFLGRWYMEAHILRSGASAQRSILNVNWGRQDMSTGVPRPGVDSTNMAIDLTANVNVNIRAQSPDAAGEITLDSWFVEILR